MLTLVLPKHSLDFVPIFLAVTSIFQFRFGFRESYSDDLLKEITACNRSFLGISLAVPVKKRQLALR